MLAPHAAAILRAQALRHLTPHNDKDRPLTVVPDVLIVGAGIVGCAAGEALGRQGASVGFVDPRGRRARRHTGVSGDAHAVQGGPAQSRARSARPAQPLVVGRVRRAAVRRRACRRRCMRAPDRWRSRSTRRRRPSCRRVASAHAARGVRSRYLKGADARQLERDIAAELRGRPAHAGARVRERAGGDGARSGGPASLAARR